MPTTPSTLTRAEIDAAVAAERLHLADHVADLTTEQWSTPSLCTAWTVRDVIAHLTLTTRLRWTNVLGGIVRARGSFDRMEAQFALRQSAAHRTDDLLALLRDSAGSNRRTPGSTPMDPLMDLVIHAQDISRPLGRRYASPPEIVTASLAYVATNRFMGGRKRFDGIRVVSTDSAWALGDGPELRGPDLELLLVAAGRPAGLDGVEGPAAPLVASRLGAAPE